VSQSKSRKPVQEGRIALDNIQDKEFELLADLVAGWISRGQVKVRFWLPSDLSFDFDEEEIEKELKKHSLPYACLGQMRYDIPVMVFGILSGLRKSVANFLTGVASVPDGVPQPTGEEIKNEVDARIKCVEDKVVSSGLRRQYAVKHAAKTNTYAGISWDVVEKQGESTVSVGPGLVHATVRIATLNPMGRPTHRESFVPFLREFLGKGQEEGVTLTMTLEDVRDLVEGLEDCAGALRRAIEGKERR